MANVTVWDNFSLLNPMFAANQNNVSISDSLKFWALSNPLTALPVIAGGYQDPISKSYEEPLVNKINNYFYGVVTPPPPPPSYGVPTGGYSTTGVTNPNAIDTVITNQQIDWNNQIFKFMGDQAVKGIQASGNDPSNPDLNSGLTLTQQIAIGLISGLVILKIMG